MKKFKSVGPNNLGCLNMTNGEQACLQQHDAVQTIRLRQCVRDLGVHRACLCAALVKYKDLVRRGYRLALFSTLTMCTSNLKLLDLQKDSKR